MQDNLPNHLPRPILDEVEATRLIIMKLHVTRVEKPGPEDGQALPVVHFEGLSRSLDSSWDDNANSDIRGINMKGTPLLSIYQRSWYLWEFGLTMIRLRNRTGALDAGRRSPLDDVVHLQRSGAVA